MVHKAMFASRVETRRQKILRQRPSTPWPAALLFWLGASALIWLLIWGIVAGLSSDVSIVGTSATPGLDASH